MAKPYIIQYINKACPTKITVGLSKEKINMQLIAVAYALIVHFIRNICTPAQSCKDVII